MRSLMTICAALFILACAHTAFCPHAAAAAPQDSTISLAGSWDFRLDPQDQGIKSKWFDAALPEKINLPGSTDQAGFGTKTTGRAPHWLNRVYEYVGAAWYQKEVTVPDEWKDKRIVLFLERCHWETQVWVDGKHAGMQDSLCTPHEYDLTALVPPGKHRLSIRVDNRMKINVGKDAHSVADHTQTNWNGIVGKIELRATDRIWIEDVQAYPDVKTRTARFRVTIRNETGKPAEAYLDGGVHQVNGPRPKTVKPKIELRAFRRETTISAVKVQEVTLSEGDAEPWDEFSPYLYELELWLVPNKAKETLRWRSQHSTHFALRDFRTEGTQFAINGRKTFLRGTLECCIFPRTGHPPMDVESWQRIVRVAKDHGLNHFRFHSWCPPEAAFEAADREGFYFHVETPVWTVLGSDPKVDQFIYAESDRILKYYGNHPSFVMLCVGNEPSGPNQAKFLGGIVNYWKQKDPRRVYTSTSGWPSIPENQYHSRPQPRIQAWGQGLKSRVNAGPLSTDVDYRSEVAQFKVPVVSHEIGQWCVYPNFDEIKKYTGVVRARNFEIFRDSLAAHGMLDQAHEFLMASGKLQALLYKEEIEAALRTPGFGGFQLLDLHDFPGQGTALVGVLDPFWDSKGYIKPEEFRQFCSETVPLVRMKKCVWTSDETFTAEAEVAHYGKAPLEKVRVAWGIGPPDKPMENLGHWGPVTIPVGGCTPLGKITLKLDRVAVPTKLALTVVVAQGDIPYPTEYANRWDVWIYPTKVDTAPPAEVKIATSLDQDALAALSAGKRVLLMPPLAAIRSNVPPGFSSIFWNTAWTHRQPPHTLGILCKPEHPALARFPTEFHSNWQWWDLVAHGRAMILDSFPKDFRPIVQVIDDWNTNRKLGLVFEAKVGGGKLLMCSIDLKSDLQKRPVARQMLHSLLQYMGSDQFEPAKEIDVALVRSLLRGAGESPLGSRAKILKVDSQAPDYEAEKALDGDPETCWHTAWEPSPSPFPHEIQLDLGAVVAIQGIRYLPRQDMVNGRIADYEVYVSDDGRDWGQPAAKGKFPAGAAELRVLLDRARKARYLRFVALSELSGQAFASMAELNVITEK